VGAGNLTYEIGVACYDKFREIGNRLKAEEERSYTDIRVIS
jgi:hypothetical protein